LGDTTDFKLPESGSMNPRMIQMLLGYINKLNFGASHKTSTTLSNISCYETINFIGSESKFERRGKMKIKYHRIPKQNNEHI